MSGWTWWGVEFKITYGYASTWSSSSYTALVLVLVFYVVAPTVSKKNVKIFETIKIISKDAIHGFEHEGARIEFKIFLFWWKQQILSQILSQVRKYRACLRARIFFFTAHNIKDGIYQLWRPSNREGGQWKPCWLILSFSFFSFLFLSLIPSKMGGKPYLYPKINQTYSYIVF